MRHQRLMLFVLAFSMATPGVALSAQQDDPPLPVGEMVQAWVEDSTYLGWITLVNCPPTPGSWQYEFIDELIRVSSESVVRNRLAGVLSIVANGCDSELISSFLRSMLRSPEMASSTLPMHLAPRLGRMPGPENRLVAMEAMFDPRFDPAVRDAIVSNWVQDSDTPLADGLALMAEAYRAVDGVPPLNLHIMAVDVRSREGEAVGLSALRTVLDALVEEPEKEAASLTLGYLIDATGGLAPDDPWVQELGAVTEAFADGRRPASEALRVRASDKQGALCRGPEERQRLDCPR